MIVNDFFINQSPQPFLGHSSESKVRPWRQRSEASNSRGAYPKLSKAIEKHRKPQTHRFFIYRSDIKCTRCYKHQIPRLKMTAVADAWEMMRDSWSVWWFLKQWRHKTLTTVAPHHSTWHGTSAQRASTSTPGQAQGKKIVVASKLPNLRILHVFFLNFLVGILLTFNWMIFFCFSVLLVCLFLSVLSPPQHHHPHLKATSVCIIIDFVPPATQSSLGTVLDSLGAQKDFWWVVWGSCHL